MRLLLVALALAGCAPTFSIANLNHGCVAYGVHASVTFPHGTHGVSVGCIAARPYPGMP